MKFLLSIFLLSFVTTTFATDITEADIQNIYTSAIPQSRYTDTFDDACTNFYYDEKEPNKTYRKAQIRLDFSANELSLETLDAGQFFATSAHLYVRCENKVEWICEHTCHFLKPVDSDKWFVDGCDN